MLTILDRVVVGEGEEPLALKDVPVGAVLAATDPLAVDLAAVRLIGFDEQKLPKLRGAMADEDLWITALRDASDVCVLEMDPQGFGQVERRSDEVRAERVFKAHAGWREHVERTQT